LEGKDLYAEAGLLLRGRSGSKENFPSGARKFLAIGSQRFRAGLTFAAPTARKGKVARFAPQSKQKAADTWLLQVACWWIGLGAEILELGEAEGGAEVFPQLDPVLFWDGEEDFDHFGIELGAGTAADFIARMAHRKSFAVGAVADHGVEGVGDGEDARSEWNFFAAEAAGITGAVKEFLVGENDFGGIAEKGNARQDVVADFAVSAHDLFFVVVERAGFAEDGIGNGHFADVVKECGASEDRQIIRGYGNCPGDGNGKGGNALAVTFGFRVLQVQGAAKGFQSVVVGLLEFETFCFESSGTFLDFFLEIGLVVADFDDQAAVLKGALDAVVKLVFLERFQDVIVGTAADGFEGRGNVVDGGDHNNGYFWVEAVQPVEESDAVHLRHNHVA
jgi:hypothetical protein